MFDELVSQIRALPTQFKVLPNTIKSGILFLIAGWISLYFTIFSVFKEEMPLRAMIAGALVCFLIIKMVHKKNWARALCMLSNIFIVVQLILPTIVLFQKGAFNFAIITGSTVVFFSLSSYYLFIRESAAYFKTDEKEKSEAVSVENK